MGGYVFQPYPKCKYHPDGRVVVVEHAGEELALGLEWSDRPVLPSPPQDEPAVTPEDPPRRRGRPRKQEAP